MAFAANDATVIVLRGVAKLDGKTLALKDTVPQGATIKTEAKSFVKLLFPDKTQMNVGPDTTLKIERTQAGEPGLVNLVGGQLRAKVTKDLLQGENEGNKDKLLIKTKTAAMGIRGTDFNVTFNPQNEITALITFEGTVAMTRMDANSNPQQALQTSDSLQMVSAGQFSGAQPDLPQASQPVKISPAQLESLKSNDSFQGLGEKLAKSDVVASPVPPGVDPKNFSSGATTPTGGPPPEGFFNAQSGSYAPRAGGFVDLNSGRYIPPPPGSSFDPNTGVFVPPTAAGNFDPNTGMYVPPKGLNLDPVKGFVPEATPTGTISQAQAMATALNYASQPNMAGVAITFDKLFTPLAGGPMPPPPPPPPPGSFPPPPDYPLDDPTCPTCQSDNINHLPTSTNVHFQITVQ